MNAGEPELPSTVLVIVDGPPDSTNAGESFLRTLASASREWRMPRFSVLREANGERQPVEWTGGHLWTRSRLRERPPNRLPRLLRWLWSVSANAIAASWSDRRAAAAVARVVNKVGADAVWIVLNSPGVIRIALSLQRLCPGIPTMVTVWDPPETFAATLRMDRLSAGLLLRDFEQVVRRSDVLLVASEPMREAYQSRFDRAGRVHVLGVPCTQAQSPRALPARGQDLVLAVAGNLYASDAWNALLEALDSAGWTVQGRPVVLRVFGPRLAMACTGPRRVDYRGWSSEAELLRSLRECHLGYVPYWFDEAMEIPARLCFPNKAALYVASGLPMLVHAPSYSSIARFVRETGSGFLCDDLASSRLADVLSDVVQDASSYSAACTASAAVHRELLNEAAFMEVFRSALRDALASISAGTRSRR